VAAVGAVSCSSVEEVLERADFVSLHCPGSAENRHLLNAERLSVMRPHAFLINTARGDIVEEAALVAALKAGTIAGAGLDVYENEPKVSPDLASLENVVLLPHLGSATEETRVAMGMRVARNVQAFFAGEPPPDRVA
jgi:lactate dehydrogenase-like 2-hydroxyacid dehydrogenase